MQAILLKEVEGLGEAGTVVTVARGYMRNFLLPRGMAEEATPARIAEVRRREEARRGRRDEGGGAVARAGRAAGPHDPDAQGEGRRRRPPVRLHHRGRRGDRHRGGPRREARPPPHHGGAPDPGGRDLLRAGGSRPRSRDRGQDHREPTARLSTARPPGPASTAVSTSTPPPQNLDAESMLLASLMEVGTYVAEAQGILDAEDFYREGHRAVYRAIMDLFHVGEPVEPITVIEQLTKNGELDAAGGRGAVLDLMETPFIAASYRTYAEIIRDASTQRRLLRVSREIERMIAQREGETSGMIRDAETLIYELSGKGVRGDFTRADKLVIKGLERLTAAEESGGGVVGVPDRVPRPRQHHRRASRPGTWSSWRPGRAWARRPSPWASATMPPLQQEPGGRRVRAWRWAATSWPSGSCPRTGRRSTPASSGPARTWGREMTLLGKRTTTACRRPMFIDDSAWRTMLRDRAPSARRLKRRAAWIWDDRRRLHPAHGGRTEPRDRPRPGEIARSRARLKMLARDLEVPVICALAAQPRRREPQGQAPDALRPARDGCHRAGRRHRPVASTATPLLQPRGRPRKKGIAEVHRRQAPQRRPTDRVERSRSASATR